MYCMKYVMEYKKGISSLLGKVKSLANFVIEGSKTILKVNICFFLLQM